MQAHGPEVVIQNLDVWWELWSHKGVHCEMATNVIREFPSIIQDERGVENTLSRDQYSIYKYIFNSTFDSSFTREKNGKVIKATLSKKVWM